MAKGKDTDFLYISTLVRAKENQLLTGEQVERMIEARTDEDAARVLEECGYEGVVGVDSLTLERRLNSRVDAILRELVARGPEPGMVDVFRLKYDYHNAKVLIKAEAANVDGKRLMSGSGRVDPDVLADAYYQQSFLGLPDVLAGAIVDAKETLARTGDAQRADIVLDKAFYREFLQTADETGSTFLAGYIRLSIDSANLRAAIRAGRMEMSGDLLGEVLIEGGNVSAFSIQEAVKKGESLEGLFASSPLEQAAAAGRTALEGAPLTEFERLCDNALAAYLKSAKYVSFGDAPLVAYIGAVEAEMTTVRIVLNGRACKLEPARIRERLRETYV